MLSGYAGTDFESFARFAWAALKGATERVLAEARRLGIWVILGSAHPLSEEHHPHNGLYVIDARGEIVERYDKRFFSGDTDGHSGDLAHYSPGGHFALWSIK